MYLLPLLMMTSAALVLFSRNVVYSLALLVLTFFLSALFLIQVGLEFLGYVLIVVYVGAIAILFLFVVMTLDIHSEETASSRVRNAGGYFSHIAAFIFTLFIFWSVNEIAAPIDELFTRFDFVTDVWASAFFSGGAGAIALSLYTHNFLYLFLAGLLLLVAMVGAVLLALPPVRFGQSSYVQAHRLPGKAVNRTSD